MKVSKEESLPLLNGILSLQLISLSAAEYVLQCVFCPAALLRNSYEKPHLPFTVKWIHRKRFHGGGGFKLRIKACVGRSLWDTARASTPLARSSVSSPQSLVSNASQHITHTGLLQPSYSQTVLISNGHIHSNNVSVSFSFSTWTFSPTVLKVRFEEGTVFLYILWVMFEILCVMFLGVWKTVNHVYVLC